MNRALCALAVCLLAACSPDFEGSADPPLPAGGLWWPELEASEPTPRAQRLATIAAELEDHLARVAEQDVGPDLFRAAGELLASDFQGLFFPVGAFGINRRDVVFLTQWNRSSRGAVPDGPEPSQAKQLASLVRLSSALEARGVSLLLAPIPRPPQIYPERLLEDRAMPGDFVGADPGLARFLLDATRAGVEVLHLTPHFAAAREVSEAESDGDRYLFHDFNNHWTPRAVVLTAELVAARLGAFEGFEPGPLREDWDWVTVTARVSHPMPQQADHTLPPASLWIEAALDDARELAARQDPTSPILLLGDSNTGWYHKYGASLPDLLTAKLGRNLDVIAQQGATPETIWNAAARRPAGSTPLDKRIVVWVCEANALAELAFPLPQLLR
jgi:hypothetical protein